MRMIALLAVFCAAAPGEVKVTPEAERVRVEIDGKPFTDFYVRGTEVMKPYLDPLRSASGKIVTRRFPMAKIAGEPTDHPHQRGVWFAHAAVNHLDFWANEASYTTAKRGKITLVKLGAPKSGPESGAIQATFNWTNLAAEKLLTEERVMLFSAYPEMRIIDFDITLTAAQQVTFYDEKDGVFGIRIAAPLQEEKGTGTIVNAEGLEHEKNAWGKPSNWVDYYGEVEGEKLGIAVFDHPANPRHPTRWHVRGYGLLAANAFGLSAFTADKTQNGDLALDPGASLRFRYRVIIHPGDSRTAKIGELYKEYSK